MCGSGLSLWPFAGHSRWSRVRYASHLSVKLHSLHADAPISSLPDPSPRTLVASTRCPLRVVRGASSRFSTASGVAALISLARRVASISAHAVDVPGAGHRPMEERPRAFRDAVLDLARAAEREATGVDARARTPESVGIADPPAFATVEEAKAATIWTEGNPLREKHSKGYRGYQSATSQAIRCSRILCNAGF